MHYIRFNLKSTNTKMESCFKRRIHMQLQMSSRHKKISRFYHRKRIGKEIEKSPEHVWEHVWNILVEFFYNVSTTKRDYEFSRRGFCWYLNISDSLEYEKNHFFMIPSTLDIFGCSTYIHDHAIVDLIYEII